MKPLQQPVGGFLLPFAFSIPAFADNVSCSKVADGLQEGLCVPAF